MLKLPAKYIVDPSAYSPDILREWHWLIGNDPKILAITNFGDVLFQDTTIQLLIIGSGSVKVVANSLEEMEKRLEEGSFLNELFLTRFQEELLSKNYKLESGKIFGFKILPIFAECKYTQDNIRIASLDEYVSFVGYTMRSIQNMPDGTKVKFSVTD